MTGDRAGEFWNYLSDPTKGLIMEGDYLMNDVIRHGNYSFKDYSFLVFPYAKAYEGFLKQLFLDIKFISHLDYISNHLRLGKLMSPNLIGRLGDRSLYKKITEASTRDLADRIWNTWKTGRNQIFHFFPNNIKAVTFDEAEGIVKDIIATMEESYEKLKVNQKISESGKVNQ